MITLFTAGCTEPVGSIGFTGNMSVTNGTFSMEGEIVDETASSPTYQNVTVYLYTEDGEIIEQRRIGTFNGSSESFVMRNERVPHYIIIDSPTFWRLNTVDATYYERSEDNSRYIGKPIRDKDEFPIEVPESLLNR